MTYRFLEKQLQRLGLRKGQADEPFAAAHPAAPFWAVGDIHGRCDLLEALLPKMQNAPVVFVGDLIDRGPDSRQVLEKVFDLCTEDAETYRSLMGNHEVLLLNFLNAPERVGPAWSRSGGLQMLASYGISLGSSKPTDTAYRDARDALLDGLGQPIMDWIAALPPIWSSGNVHVVHAGADPARAMTDQTSRDLIWGHQDFAEVTRADGQWVVHGHTIVPEPVQRGGRISIDTGAFATGVLTAAHVSRETVKFVSTANAVTPSV